MIKILCVGKIKEKFFQEGVAEYLKRLQKYHQIKIIEVADESVGDILKKESDSIVKHISEKDYVITLEIEGKTLNSLEFSNQIDKLLMNYSTITFIIGGSLGLHDSIKKRSQYQLSFSTLTFPHQLFRIILLEQIYRGFKILHNESYHK